MLKVLDVALMLMFLIRFSSGADGVDEPDTRQLFLCCLRALRLSVPASPCARCRCGSVCGGSVSPGPGALLSPPPRTLSPR